METTKESTSLEELKAKAQDPDLTKLAMEDLAKKQEAPEEKRFQHYESARASVRLVSKTGMVINFVNYKYITDSDEAIAYLDDEIQQGLPGITKGAALTAEEADPVLSVKKKIIDEYLAEIKQQAADIARGDRDFGGTKGASDMKLATTKDQPK